MSGVSGRGRPTADRGQAETLGLVIILSITLIGATVAVGVGATVVNDARENSNEEGIRNAMTQLDSRTARVALGDSTAQHVPLASGTYRVDPTAGEIEVTHVNHSGNGNTEVIFTGALGAVIYEGRGSTIAYQGGGVWASTGDGSTMVSPPEFHYRGATLTLPIIRVVSTGSTAGQVTARITSDGTVRRLYPNSSATYDASSVPYENPVSDGNVSVKIQSDYYQAWAEFFRTRSDGEVEVFDENQTVRVTLFTPSSVGDFTMPSEGNSVDPSGLGENHPINDFTITLEPDPHLENMHWAFYADEGGEEFELHLYSPDKCKGSPSSYDGDFDVSIYYYDGTGSTYEGWQNSSVDPDTSPMIDVDCDANEVTVDFMAATPLEYKAIDITGNTNKWVYGDQISSMAVESDVTLDQHPDVTGEPSSYSAGVGDTAGTGFLVNHYFEILGPTFELRVSDGPGGSSRIDEEDSSGTLTYEQGGGAKFITFLHITENRVTVELD